MVGVLAKARVAKGARDTQARSASWKKEREKIPTPNQTNPTPSAHPKRHHGHYAPGASAIGWRRTSRDRDTPGTARTQEGQQTALAGEDESCRGTNQWGPGATRIAALSTAPLGYSSGAAAAPGPSPVGAVPRDTPAPTAPWVRRQLPARPRGHGLPLGAAPAPGTFAEGAAGRRW